MSHFTVLVPAKDKEDLEAKLLPYHEYECTGIEAYLQFIPGNLEEMKIKYEEHKTEYESLEKFAEDWYGYTKNEKGEYGRITNPNKKWDWWSIGGRWTGLLRLKSNRLLVPDSGNGSPGVMTPANVDYKYADYAPADKVDWDGMIADWRGKQRQWWAGHRVYLNLAREDVFQKPLSDKVQQAKKKAEELFNDDTRRGELARQTFQDIATAIIYEYADYLAGKDNQHWFHGWDDITKILMSQKQFEQTLDTPHAMTYAFIDLTGQWQQRGEMGWFGMDDKSRGTQNYDLAWWEFVRSIPNSLIVYVIDCHI